MVVVVAVHGMQATLINVDGTIMAILKLLTYAVHVEADHGLSSWN